MTDAFSLVVALPTPLPSVLAVGAFLKNTICVTRGAEAFVSGINGDLGTPAAIASFEGAIEALLAELGVRPVRVAHDLHPDFHSTRFAEGLDLPALPVQHHHAHGAAIAAEHGHRGPLLTLALDGFGLGPGNQAWGGELLRVDGASFQRLGHLRPLAQPGGDLAARQPWRMAASALYAMGRGSEIAARFPAIPTAVRLPEMLAKGINCPSTTSAGRLFDAACGLLGIHPLAEFEGQAPMALEALVTTPAVMAGGWRIDAGRLDLLPLLEALAAGPDATTGANLFHGTLAAALADWTVAAAAETGIIDVALGGGCFLNRVLTADLTKRLTALGLRPLTARQLSPGDSALSLGQAWIAGQLGE